LLLLLANNGCAGGWRRQWIDPARVVERDHPRELRVHRTDGTSVDLANPGIAGDSLVAGLGTWKAHAAQGWGDVEAKPRSVEPHWVPLQDIDYVDVKRSNHTTGILLLGVLLPAAMLGVMAATWE
jgi:hypothetical protein